MPCTPRPTPAAAVVPNLACSPARPPWLLLSQTPVAAATAAAAAAAAAAAVTNAFAASLANPTAAAAATTAGAGGGRCVCPATKADPVVVMHVACCCTSPIWRLKPMLIVFCRAVGVTIKGVVTVGVVGLVSSGEIVGVITVWVTVAVIGLRGTPLL